MSETTRPVCPECGAALAANAPGDLCPSCLMAMNLASQTVLPEEDTSAPGAPASPVPSLEEIAPHFPQFDILECLGRGGMGVVYKARQITLNRLVALKLLAPERVTDPKFAERFTHEAQALAALNHPNIVTIHDFGQAGGFYYLLMEFVDGVNLRQAMKAGRFTPEQALAIVPPVCEALQYAHNHGIVHRDIKPENLLLDKEGRVMIADFGIAKMLGAGASGVGLAETQPAGTPQYMAPEQQTAPQQVDNRADIYSLGVVLYEMLTGELPGKLLEPPSHKVRMDVRLDAVVLRALEKKPELRYQQVSDVKTMVETIVSTPGGTKSEDRSQKTELKPRFSRTAIIVGWIARGLALIGFLFILTFILAEGLPAFWKQPPSVQVELVGMVTMLIGLLLGWKHEGWGAILIAAGWSVFAVIEHGRPPWPFTAFLIIAGLYAYGWRKKYSLHTKAPPQVPNVGKDGGANFQPLEKSAPRFWRTVIAVVTTLVIAVVIALVIGAGLRNIVSKTSTYFPHDSGQAEVRYRVFEADADFVDKLVPTGSRTRGDLPSERQTISTPANATTQMTEINAATLEALLKGMPTDTGLWLDKRCTVQFKFWPYWAEGCGETRTNGRVGVTGFLGVRRVPGTLQLHVQDHVTYHIEAPWSSAEIFYEGNAPQPGHARTFFIPFSRNDGTRKYLIAAFEVGRDKITTNSPATPADAQPLSFGPEIERTILAAEEGPESKGLSFDTNQLVDLPPTFAGMDAAARGAWLRDQPSNVIFEFSGGCWCLLCNNMNYTMVHPTEWPDAWNRMTSDQFTASFCLPPGAFQAAMQNLRKAPNRFALDTTNPYTPILDPPILFAFQSEHNAGFLQILGFTNNPRGVKIRYKLLHDATTPLVIAAAAQQLSFGPEVRHVITEADADHDGLVFFRMETGLSFRADFMSIPTFVAQMPFAQITPELRQWIKATQPDVLLRMTDKDWAMMNLDMQEEPVGQPKDWGHITPEQVVAVFAKMDAEHIVRKEVPHSEAWGAYGFGTTTCRAFRTRGNLIGVYQIEAAPNAAHPTLVFHYKLVSGLRQSK